MAVIWEAMRLDDWAQRGGVYCREGVALVSLGHLGREVIRIPVVMSEIPISDSTSIWTAWFAMTKAAERSSKMTTVLQLQLPLGPLSQTEEQSQFSGHSTKNWFGSRSIFQKGSLRLVWKWLFSQRCYSSLFQCSWTYGWGQLSISQMYECCHKVGVRDLRRR